MYDKKISLLPVVDNQNQPLAIVHEIDILRGLTSKKLSLDSKVKDISVSITDLIPSNSSLNDLLPIFERDRAAIVVDDKKQVLAVLTEIDLVEHIGQQLNKTK